MTQIIGLTGGIASGKTTVSEYFKQRQLPVIDADQVARDVVKPEQPALKEIVAIFGEKILTKDGELNRSKLGQIIFNEPEVRQKVNDIMHPYILQKIKSMLGMLSANGEPLVILDVPLLFESASFYALCDETIVVWVPRETQLNRLKARNHYSDDEAEARIASQWPLDKKRLMADSVFDNSTTKESLYQQIDDWLASHMNI
ncbi:MAG: dephospho-CoA kinase [Aerococcus suis]|nr:dephospho-CoA kinase [Aerococcus suis]